MSVVKIENLCKNYNVNNAEINVLKNINLQIPTDKITVILGVSGCGKTTLLRTIGNLEKVTSGEIIKPEGKIGFVFQEPRLMPWLTVSKNIKFGVKRRYKIDISNVIKTVKLDGFEKAYPNQLSGGMQQRVSLARALVYKPTLILMDEPFAALDYFTRMDMQKELISVWKDTNCGILFVTHSIEEAMAIGHNVIILENGAIKKEYKIETAHNERDLDDSNFLQTKKDIIYNLTVQ